MQFFILIPNIMLILHENQALVVKSSKYECNFTTDLEKIDFLSKGTKILKAHTYFCLPPPDGSNDVRLLEKCFETKHYIGLGEQEVTASSDGPSPSC